MKLSPYVCINCGSGVQYKDYLNIGTRSEPLWRCRRCVELIKKAAGTTIPTVLT